MFERKNYCGPNATSKPAVSQLFYRALIFITICFASLLGPLPASASAKATSGNGSYTITLYAPSQVGTPALPGKTIVGTGGKPIYPVLFPTLTTDSKQFQITPCVAVFFKYYSTKAQAAYAYNLNPQLWFTLNRHYGPCKSRQTNYQTSPTPPKVSQSTIVAEVSRLLPSPAPVMTPYFGIFGLDSYLSSGAKFVDQISVSTIAGKVVAVASGQLTIDYGDGSTPFGPTSNSGGTYPLGDLMHLYKNTGCYRITIVENWSVNYSGGGSSGTIGGITTRGSLNNYCVYQMNALMVR